MEYDVFICYSRRDSNIAEHICDTFDANGIKYYIDRKMQIGSVFTTSIAEAISASRLFLFLVSGNSTASFYVQCELHFACKRFSSNFILPYIIDNAAIPDGIDLMLSPLNQLNILEHPVNTVLVNHVKKLLDPAQTKIEQEQSISLPSEFAMAGMKFFSENKFDEAFVNFTIAAEQGHVQSQYQLGVCYELGYGTPRNMTMAANNYRKAAESGNTEAQAKIAQLCFEGYYIPRNDGEAFRFFKLAADKGNCDAQVGLARCYELGRGVSQSISSARFWYSAAALQGDSKAMGKLKSLK